MSYKIVRFRRKSGSRPRVIRQGLTLEEARTHCSRGDTRGPRVECGVCGLRQKAGPSERCSACGGFMVSDWFDGYEEA